MEGDEPRAEEKEVFTTAVRGRKRHRHHPQQQNDDAATHADGGGVYGEDKAPLNVYAPPPKPIEKKPRSITAKKDLVVDRLEDLSESTKRVLQRIRLQRKREEEEEGEREKVSGRDRLRDYDPAYNQMIHEMAFVYPDYYHHRKGDLEA